MPTTETAPRDIPSIFRIRIGLTQGAVARRARIAVRTLSQMERGGSTNLDLIQRVSAVLGVETSEYVAAMEHRAAQIKAGPLSRKRARTKGAA